MWATTGAGVSRLKQLLVVAYCYGILPAPVVRSLVVLLRLQAA